MPVIFQKLISSSDLDMNPDTIYVFGDNDIRKGTGGLAKICRGRSNAVGIRTKKLPSMDPIAFLTDDEYNINIEWFSQDMEKIIAHLETGKVVVFPTAPLGSGLAELQTRAPITFQFLRDLVEELVNLYSG